MKGYNVETTEIIGSEVRVLDVVLIKKQITIEVGS